MSRSINPRPLAGRPARGDKEWRNAIRIAVHGIRRGPDGKGKVKVLRALAERLVDMAIQGDVAAMKEIGDRLDGKAQQSVDLQGNLTLETALSEVISTRGVPQALPSAAVIEHQSEEEDAGDGPATH